MLLPKESSAIIQWYLGKGMQFVTSGGIASAINIYLRGIHFKAPARGFFLYIENSTLDVEFRRAFSGESVMKTPFDIIKLRSANCNKISKGGHSR